MFKSIQDAIRFKAFLSANGLQDSFMERQSQFIYSFNFIFVKKEKYIQSLIQFIQDVKRDEWVNNVLRDTYKYNIEDERIEILNIMNQMFMGERIELVSLVGKLDEEDVIREAVTDLLDYNGAVLFESFLRFRLKKYFERVLAYLNVAIDEYKMEQEYQMFVNMLRDYLKNRGPRLDIVHVLLEKPILFFNEILKEMGKEEIKEIMDRRLLSNHPVYVDSSVIAPLLSMAPKKIFLYTDEEDQPLIRTLKNIFEERLSILSITHLNSLLNIYSDT
ncbi:putative sporulation protein YtxC [Lederbergia panacisoli]|uniref:putative sporulation protein YtxC n=1 Tax=Lederbergia panacisoli TaxID=1255251 RepID=UPI00214B94B0|nr:putative sporulation protein YtxC [Lederbergia panacisoli]MCR2821918.1 putative sporulation protein YtxC [Lederbergia panacisoli]